MLILFTVSVDSRLKFPFMAPHKTSVKQQDKFFPGMVFLQILNFPIYVIKETQLTTEIIQYNDYLGEKNIYIFCNLEQVQKIHCKNKNALKSIHHFYFRKSTFNRIL